MGIGCGNLGVFLVLSAVILLKSGVFTGGIWGLCRYQLMVVVDGMSVYSGRNDSVG